MKNFASGFVGLLLVGVMACTSFGQTYVQAVAAIDAYSAEIGECDGASASYIVTNDNTLTIKTEIESLLADPRFLASYNPDGPAAKAAFEDMLETLESVRIGNYEEWQTISLAHSNEMTAIPDTPAELLIEADGTWDWTWLHGFTWAQGKYQDIIDLANAHKARVAVFTNQFQDLADRAADLLIDYATLRDLVAAY